MEYRILYIVILVCVAFFAGRIRTCMRTAEEQNASVSVEEYTNELMRYERNSIRISFDKGENAKTYTGCSKYGGQPDVPEDFVWPVDDSKRPLAMLFQLQCSDIQQYDIEWLLPETGHLYFFYELQEMNWENTGNCVRVIYCDAPNNKLHKADYPKTLAEEFRIKEMPLIFARQKSYPSFEDFSNLCPKYDKWNDEFDTAYEKLMPEDSTRIGTMLGYASLIQGEIVDNLDDRIMLFQLNTIDGSGESDIMFGDCGSIYFYISLKDLKAKNFDNIKFELQCY